MKGIVYRATNKQNGMFYIGQTTRGIAYRRNRHINDRRVSKRDHESPFHKALDEYGRDAFEWSVLHEVDRPTREELVFELGRLESLEIANADRSMLYNQVSGGTSGFSYSRAMRKKISTGLSGKYAGVNSKTSQPVARYSVDGKLLAEYASATEASAKTRLSRTAIRECCLGKTKTAGGWKWVYVAKETNEH